MRICCAGEVMVEMAAQDGGRSYLRGVAGDTFNTAVYLARAGLDVDYFTWLGDDAFSADILHCLHEEGIGTNIIRRCPGRQPGLYVIDNDARGERSFSYWRDHSPAREMFDQLPEIPPVEAFYFSGITLAVTRSGHDNLCVLLRRLRAEGCRIVFDPNYRAELWDSVEQAREHYRAVIPLCDTSLPTLEDEAALWGIDTVEMCRDLYLEQGVSELVIKGAALTAHVFCDGEQSTSQAQEVKALDTTGAGDSFNAGYLAARFKGIEVNDALTRAQKLSAAVVQQRGAILRRE